MSSRKLEDGCVTITGCGYTWAAPGHRLYVVGIDGFSIVPAELRRAGQEFADYQARLLLSRPSNGCAGNVGITVRPDESALFEALDNGSLHPSLVIEPGQEFGHAAEPSVPVAPPAVPVKPEPFPKPVSRLSTEHELQDAA
jgi:hypothetical protein